MKKTLSELEIKQHTPLYRSINNLRRRGFLRFRKFENVYLYDEEQINFLRGCKVVTADVKRRLKEI